jgi:phage shock protein PspC (stress-responsive transcriptional regulator)
MKRLYRSGTERILGGVCAGIGEYADVDPTVVRLVWVVLTLLSLGVGLVAYIIAWIIIPEGKSGPEQNVEKTPTG